MDKEVITKYPLAQCNLCPWKDYKLVPTLWPPNAVELAIVAEAPGAEEVVQGEPLAPRSVGRLNAGTVLKQCLEEVGLSREKCLITNVCLCRPPSGGNPTPKSPEIAACSIRLQAELRTAKPKLILALGGVSVKALTGRKESLGSLRGDLLHTSWGLPVWATYHPAALFRDGNLRKDLMLDLKRVKSLLAGEELEPPKPNRWTLVNDLKTLKQVVRNLVDYEPIACDLETGGTGYIPEWGGKILCINLSVEEGHSYIIPGAAIEHPEGLRLLNKLFEYPGVRWMFHNAKFDVRWLRAAGINAHADHDTMIMSYTLDERQGVHSLKALAQRLLRVPSWEGVPRSYLKSKADSFENIPKEVLYPYAALDVDYTRRIFWVMDEEMDEQAHRLHNDLLIPASEALMRVEDRGMLVDREYLEGLKQSMGREIEKLHASFDFNPASPRQVAQALAREGVLLPTKRDTGNVTTDKAVLESIQDQVPLAKSLLEYRKLSKLFSTYVLGLEDDIAPDGRIHTTYLIHGTVTGRLSSSRPNMQNIPRESPIKNAFVPSPGYVFLQADYDQHEFRVMCWLSGDEWLFEVLSSGRKLHAEVATEIYGPDYDHEGYMAAKMVNFGILYQRGAASLGRQLGISTTVAQAYIDDFFRRMPKVKQWVKRVQNEAVTTGQVEQVFGRRRRFGLITRENLYEVLKQAVNFPCSSIASDLMLFSMIALNELQDTERVRIVASIHDALLFEVREDVLQEEAARITKIMELTPQYKLQTELPFKVELKVGPRWGELKDYEF